VHAACWMIGPQESVVAGITFPKCNVDIAFNCGGS